MVTNPPFSLFREYLAQLIEHDKKFLILGNQNAITYKEVFPLLKDEKMWLGVHSNKVLNFRIPSSYEYFSYEEGGEKYARVPAINWFTNLDNRMSKPDLLLYKKYDPEYHLRYDNYDAINVDKVVDIPLDYDGVMGVPITYVQRHDPDQFEIVGLSEQCGRGFSGSLWRGGVPHPLVRGKKKYSRLFIRREQ